jgi:hypothetical protein
MNTKGNAFRWWENGIIAIVILAAGIAEKIGGPLLAAVVGGVLIVIWIEARKYLPYKIYPSARKVKEAIQNPLVEAEHVVRFYRTTRKAWSCGTLSDLNKGYEDVGKLLMEDFIKEFSPYEGSALRTFFEDFPPLDGEFLIALGNRQVAKNCGWFVLTNLRLVQRDGRSNEFKEVALHEVDTYNFTDTLSTPLVFKMKSGENIIFEKVKMLPTDRYLSAAISRKFTV